MKRICKFGFTLIEIIISLAIFAIMSLGFYGAFSTIFISTFRTSEITESVFLAQSELEKEIQEIKDILKPESTEEVSPDIDKLSISIFSRTVVAYHLSTEVINGTQISTLITETRPPRLRVPVFNSVPILSVKSPTNVLYPNVGHNPVIIDAITPTYKDGSNSYEIHRLNYWYSSLGRYYIPYNATFPDQFELIPYFSTQSINFNPSQFDGKIIQMMMTPVGEKGQVGESASSTPVLISRMKTNRGLLVHLDASYINPSDNDQVKEIIYLNRWNDITNKTGYSSIATSTSTTSNNARPLVNYETLGSVNDTGSTLRDILSVSRYSNQSNENVAQISTLSTNVSTENSTMYVAIKFDNPGVLTNKKIIDTDINNTNNRSKFIFGTDSNGYLFARKFNSSGTNRTVTLTNYPYKTDKWAIFKFEIFNNRLIIQTDLTYDAQLTANNYILNQSVANSSSLTAAINFTNLSTIFETGYSIGEIMLYDSTHTATDSQDVLKYLYEKYILK